MSKRLANRTISHFLQLTTVIRHVSDVLQCFKWRMESLKLREVHYCSVLCRKCSVQIIVKHRLHVWLVSPWTAWPTAVLHSVTGLLHHCTLSVPLFSAAACSGWVTQGCHTDYWCSDPRQSLDTYMTDQILGVQNWIASRYVTPRALLKWSRGAAMCYVLDGCRNIISVDAGRDAAMHC